jgi:hypothetical protein
MHIALFALPRNINLVSASLCCKHNDVEDNTHHSLGWQMPGTGGDNLTSFHCNLSLLTIRRN